MKLKNTDIRQQISAKGLKVTPQRVAILEFLRNTGTHPTADDILSTLRQTQPNIAIGTVYKVLDTFVAHGIIHKITSKSDKMRYDGNTAHHHHLHCTKTDKIIDYTDEKLNKILHDYFKKKDIKGFCIEDMVLQINGTFTN